MSIKYSDRAKRFLARNPTRRGVIYYEHPARGDEHPLIGLKQDGTIFVSCHYELPD